MLATHLSFPEIGAEMFLSPNTIKSQAMSIYRKLGATTRNQAVTRSRELGLTEGLITDDPRPDSADQSRPREWQQPR
jgi:LuxR family maltose regulon positive regulatory protein